MPTKGLPLTELGSGDGSNKSLKQLYADKQLAAFRTKLTELTAQDKDFLGVLHDVMKDTDSERSAFLAAIVEKLDAADDVAMPKLRLAAQVAADAGNLAALRLLLHNDAALASRVRRLEAQDEIGLTPLHAAVIAAAENADAVREECVAWLLKKHQECQVDLRGLDTSGRTALYVAAKFGSVSLVKRFLEYECIGLDIPLGDEEGVESETARRLLLLRFPELTAELATRPPDAELLLGDRLHLLLTRADEVSQKEFCALVAACEGDASALHRPRRHLSLMQRACMHGLTDAVEALLTKAPALAATPAGAYNRTEPLLLAVEFAREGVIELFHTMAPEQFQGLSVSHDDTVLIMLVRHWMDDDPKSEERYHACLKLLLSDSYRALVDVNATNKWGDSALHLSALCLHTRASLALLARGAWLAPANQFGKRPLDYLLAATLRTHLDACVTSKAELNSANRELFFDYTCLRTPTPTPTSTRMSSKSGDAEAQHDGGDTPLREMEALVVMSRSKELRVLLKHPVLNSFLDHKWQKMSMLFYVNAVLYSLFVWFVTLHIWREKNPTHASNVSRIAATVFWLPLVLREAVQFLIDWRRYLCELENYLEVFLLVCAGMTLAQWPFDEEPQRRIIPALTVLLAWGEFVLLLGRHPRCATYVEMLKTVTMNFLKFLGWFAGLIIAFTLCFYTLFHDEPSLGAESGSESEAFSSLSLSWFKTFVMMAGELDVGNVPLDALPSVSRTLFVAFIFLVMFVLLNLLNGLAVSDTQAIQNDAELVCYASRVKTAERVESKLFDWLQLKGLRCPCLASLVAQVINFAAVVRSEDEPTRGWLRPNADRVLRIGLVTGKLVPSPYRRWLDRWGFGHWYQVAGQIVKRAEDLLAERGASSEMRDLEERLGQESRAMEARLMKRMGEMVQEMVIATRVPLDQPSKRL